MCERFVSFFFSGLENVMLYENEIVKDLPLISESAIKSTIMFNSFKPSRKAIVFYNNSRNLTSNFGGFAYVLLSKFFFEQSKFLPKHYRVGTYLTIF